MKKILVVDDHPTVLKFLSTLLEKKGHQVLTAQDGLSALDVLKDFTPDIIFVDLIMPNIRGDKLCRIIRSMPSLKGVYLVILSAIATEQKLDLAELRVNACIAKGPIDKMGQHVLAEIDRLDRKIAPHPTQRVIGGEEVRLRAITKELLFSTRHLEVIFDHLSEGLLDLTPDAKIISANSAAISIINIPEEKLLSLDFADLFDDPHRKRIKGLLDIGEPQMVTDDSPVALDGKLISLSILPVKDDEYSSIAVILRDITEKLRIEAQFQQAQKMEAIGTLAAGIAHDFNNLLMVVQGNASLMLLSKEPDSQDYEGLKSIEQHVSMGARLTKQLLSFAKGGRNMVRPADLNEILKANAEMFGRAKKEISIYSKYQKDIHLVAVDEGQIEQVFLNLYINAWQAMPDGGKLFVETKNVILDEDFVRPFGVIPGEYVKASITDTGVGIDKTIQSRIFEPFFTTKEVGRGTGLGLASAYGIIKNHGGIIEVHSEKGKGTTFEVYLPAGETEMMPRLIKSKSLDDGVSRGTETILLVDDEDAVIDTGNRMLKKLGYTVLPAKSGQEGIDLYETNKDRIDLVILDMIMPDMGGAETFERMKELNPNMKTLFCSGYSLSSLTAEILERGCNAFIQKPFTLERLSRKIREILARNADE